VSYRPLTYLVRYRREELDDWQEAVRIAALFEQANQIGAGFGVGHRYVKKTDIRLRGVFPLMPFLFIISQP